MKGKFTPIRDPVSAEQWSQRVKDERAAYKDMFNSINNQLVTYAEMAANGGSILEDLRTWESLFVQNKTVGNNTHIIRTSLQFQHTLNVAFGRLCTTLTATVSTKLDYYSKDVVEKPKPKDDRESMRLVQDSEEKYIAVMENYWKSYAEFFRQGYQLCVNIKSFFLKLHPEDPVFVEPPKAFGKDLAKIWEDESELRIAIYILKYFEEYGSLDDNVFKNNVPSEAVKAIIQILEKGMIPLSGSTEAMAHVMLHWVNSLADPVFSISLQREFLEVANMVTLQTKKEKMISLLNKLPRPNRIVLLAIIRGCVKIAREKTVGNLRYTQILLEKIADLAACIGPPLTRCPIEQVPLAQSLLRYLILNAELFFPIGCEEERYFVTEVLKLGKIMKLNPEPWQPPPSPTEGFIITKPMKIGERNSSKNFTIPSPSPSSFLSLYSGNATDNSPASSPNPLSRSTTMSDPATAPPLPPKRIITPASQSQSTPSSPLLSSQATSDEEEDPLVSITNNFITTNTITNNVITNNITNIILPTSPLSTSTTTPKDNITSAPTPPLRTGSGIGIGGGRANIAPLTLLTPPTLYGSYNHSSPESTPPTTPRKGKKGGSEEFQRLTASSSDDSEPEFGTWEAGVLAPIVAEAIQKQAREVIAKIEQIKLLSDQSDFDDSLKIFRTLQAVIKDVEQLKTHMQLGTEFDKSELANTRGDKLARIRTTVQILAREITYVMESVVSICSASEVTSEARAGVGACLARILTKV